MKKLANSIISAALVFGLLSGIGPIYANAASQSSYKLTAYNSHGKKLNVNASKGLVVKKVSGKSWYKGSMKYSTYKKVRGKWKKQTKTSTIYVPSSKVKKYSKVVTETKPVTTTKWIKNIKTVKGWFDGTSFGGTWIEEVHTGDIAKAGSEILIPDGDNGYGGFFVYDMDGNDDVAVSLEDAVLTQEPDPAYNYLGYANVKYVDYDPKEVSINKKVTTTIFYYKTTAKTLAYTKIYVAPKPGITLSRYNKIKIGMTYNQVIAITHDKGILKSAYSSSRTSYKQYEFRQDKDEYKYAFISFVNGKVKSKLEANLY